MKRACEQCYASILDPNGPALVSHRLEGPVHGRELGEILFEKLSNDKVKMSVVVANRAALEYEVPHGNATFPYADALPKMCGNAVVAEALGLPILESQV